MHALLHLIYSCMDACSLASEQNIMLLIIYLYMIQYSLTKRRTYNYYYTIIILGLIMYSWFNLMLVDASRHGWPHDHKLKN